jgi:hypothetical protein
MGRCNLTNWGYYECCDFESQNAAKVFVKVFYELYLCRAFFFKFKKIAFVKFTFTKVET